MTFTDWMVQRSLEYAREEGIETVVGRLQAQGYLIAADRVMAAWNEENDR